MLYPHVFALLISLTVNATEHFPEKKRQAATTATAVVPTESKRAAAKTMAAEHSTTELEKFIKKHPNVVEYIKTVNEDILNEGIDLQNRRKTLTRYIKDRLQKITSFITTLPADKQQKYDALPSIDKLFLFEEYQAQLHKQQHNSKQESKESKS